MRIFIKKIVAFVSIFTFSLVVLFVVNFGLYQMERSSLNIKNKNILLLGDSNMECAINDSMYSSAINKAASGDSYFYSYLKLRNYTSINPKIDTLFLSFAPHNVFENGWLLDDRHIYSHFKNYYILMDWSDFKFLFSKNPKAVINSVPSIVKQTLKNIEKKIKGISLDSSYGGFLSLERNILPEVRVKLKNGKPLPFFKIPNSFKISEEEATYLQKIISYCKSNKIKLYLINLPKRTELLNYPKYGVKNFHAEYDKKYFKIDFLDFSTMELPESNYGDFVHLNKKGSTAFTSFIQNTNIDTLLIEFGRNQTRPNNIFYQK